jgi:hypothetical protein
MTTTTYLNVFSASALSADIKAIDLASQADGRTGTPHLITFEGATLTGHGAVDGAETPF